MRKKIIEMKICATCQSEKPITAFSLNGRNGYRNRRCKPCVIINANHGDRKICSACDIEKPIDEFSTTNVYGLKKSRCKLCVINKILIPKEKRYLNGKSKFSTQRLSNVTKEDYKDTYIFLKTILGYDLNSHLSIHEQFCLRHNLTPHNPPNSFPEHFSVEECFN
jgi:hypothetical protein